MTDCIHGFAEGTCSVCKAVEEDDSLDLRPTTRAKYDGRCLVCDQRIRRGQLLVMVDDEWVHKACAD